MALLGIVSIILLVLGVPLMIVFAGVGIAGIFSQSLSKLFFPMGAETTLNSVVLLAIPFFLLSAEMMARGGLAEQILTLAANLTRRVRGGLGYTVIVGNVMMGTMSGSALSDVAATCRVILPELRNRGWDMRYGTCLVAASGGFAMLIPPSIGHIIFGLMSGASISLLFVSTVFPALIIALMFAMIHFIKAPRVAPDDMAVTRLSWREEITDITRTSIKSIPAIMAPVIILGGIYSGFFTPTEAATVAAMWAMFVGVVIYRKLTWNRFLDGLLATCNTIGVIFMLIIFVSMFTRILDILNVPAIITTATLGLSTNKYVILLLVNVIIIILGMLMDNTTGILLAVPLIMPTLTQLGVDPVHFGGFLAVNFMAGALTPPVALNLFIGSRLSGIPFNQLVGPIMPFTLVVVFVTLLTTYIPPLSLFLPSLVN